MSEDNFVPFSCPLCSFLMRDIKDTFTYMTSKCCYECKEEYLIPNGMQNSDEVELTEDIKKSLENKRISVPSYILR
jgi:hypothetical protein